MKVLVDTSVWGDFFNGHPSVKARALEQLIKSDEETTLATDSKRSSASSPTWIQWESILTSDPPSCTERSRSAASRYAQPSTA